MNVVVKNLYSLFLPTYHKLLKSTDWLIEHSLLSLRIYLGNLMNFGLG